MQNFATNDIPFNSLTFGQLFGIIKSEGLTLCNAFKLQAKYSAGKAQSRQEMGNFCETFGLERIKAPSTKRKRNFKRKSQPKRQFPPKNTGKTYKPHLPIKTKPKVAKRSSKKQNKPMVCYKCGKVGHKSFRCKMEKKINELFHTR